MQYFLHTIVSVLSCESSAGKPTSKTKIRLFWFNLIVLKTTLEKANTHPTEESKLIIRYYRESMLGEAQGAHQNYTVKRLFEKDRNSREIKTKRSTRTGILNSTSHDEILVFCKGSSRHSCFGKCKKSGT